MQEMHASQESGTQLSIVDSDDIDTCTYHISPPFAQNIDLETLRLTQAKSLPGTGKSPITPPIEFRLTQTRGKHMASRNTYMHLVRVRAQLFKTPTYPLLAVLIVPDLPRSWHIIWAHKQLAFNRHLPKEM